MRNFLIYLGDDHPAVCSLDQLRRDPHILGWFNHLHSRTPPLATAVYISRLMRLRCIREELAWSAQLPDPSTWPCRNADSWNCLRTDGQPSRQPHLPAPLIQETSRPTLVE